ncbi:MAG TPA: suppressor of fused domain protein [Acidimicrobiales bacterium]|nr:suppressor of fused domain protein [Acidimicrobiales bacterium]
MNGPVGDRRSEAPGLAALDAHVDDAHGWPADHRWRPAPAHTGQGPSPLAAVSGHLVASPPGPPVAGREHWHLVTRGLSQLAGADAGDDVLAGGWGFELSLRVALDPAEEEPLWAVELLTNLAAYVWASGHPFAAGHHIDLRGPIRISATTDITAAALVADPQLGTLDGPYGPVEFLQVVGLTADELELCRAWSTDGVVDLLARSGGLVTDLDRRSLLADPATAAEASARARAEGSELTALQVATLSLRRGRLGRGVVVQLGAGAAAALGPALRRELVADGSAFEVVGDGATVRFALAPSAGWSLDPGGATPASTRLVVAVPADELAGLAALFDGRTGWGRRRCLPGLRVRVVA